MTGKANLKNGMWTTSPGQDPLLTKLGNLMIECCDENPQGCAGCPAGEKCGRWWNIVANKGAYHPITQGEYDTFKVRFDIIRASKNGHKPTEEIQ